MNAQTYDFAVVGGGIVGLATALALREQRPGSAIVVIEKEPSWASHQTGRNSGVIHSGIYYRPGTMKARMAVEGNRAMVDFCHERGIRHDVCGKLIVAASAGEAARLQKLRDNAAANGVDAEWLDADGARRYEPHVSAVAALHVPSTGVVDYRTVSENIAESLRPDVDLRTGCRFERARDDGNAMVLETSLGSFRTRMLVNCAGLYSDRVAISSGDRPSVRIVPFRGEYLEVGGASANLVRTLIYPVPNPDFPFLGVHLTRGIDGGVHAGPNAVLALAREGYSWSDVSVRDLASTFGYGGFWRLAGRYWGEGTREMLRSFSRRRFVESVRTLVPDVDPRDFRPAPAGVRAQALTPQGALADDFVIVQRPRAVHVCNAPSPAATASLVIGRHVARVAIGS